MTAEEQQALLLASNTAYQKGVTQPVDATQAQYNAGATLVFADLLAQTKRQLLREAHLQEDGVPSDRVQQGYARQIEHAASAALLPRQSLVDMAGKG